MTDNIIWEDPPEQVRAGPKLKWIPLLTPLIKKPTKWARVETFWTPSQAYSVTRQLKRAVSGEGSLRIPEGRWEFVARKLPAENGQQSQYGVFARYLGE